MGIFLAIVWAITFGAWDILRAKAELTTAQREAQGLIANRDALLSREGRTLALGSLNSMKHQAYLADVQLTGSAPLHLLTWIPGVSNQVNGLIYDVQDVDFTVHEGIALLSAVEKTTDASHNNYIDLPSLKILTREVARAQTNLAGRIRSASGLIGPIRSARIKLNDELTTLTGLLADGHRALSFADTFLGGHGPRTYLVAGLNNSEMRDQGAVLSWALLSVNHGHFEMSHAASVGTVSLSRPAVAISKPVNAAVFGPYEPTRIWQSVNAVGDFPTSARWMSAMIQSARGTHVDGVVGVDVVTLSNLLRVVGPVRIPSIRPRVNASNVARLVLHDLYLKYPAGSQQWRHDEISSIAQATVDKMKNASFDPANLIRAMAKSIPGRHLLFYDSVPANEADVAAFHASGGLHDSGANPIHLSVQSGVAAKLDWFMHTDVTYQIHVLDTGTAIITTTVHLTNTAPAHAKPSYALGPDNTNTHIVGEYIARIYQWMPRGAKSPDAVSDEDLSLSRTILHVLPQNTRTATLQSVLRHAVKNGVLDLSFIPQGTINPANISVTVQSDMGLKGPGTLSFVGDHVERLTWTTH